MKSSLDVSFAEALVSEAELAAVQAEGETHRSRAQLAAAIGAVSGDGEQFALSEESAPPPPDASPETLVAKATQDRPDLQALSLQASADAHFSAAERALHYPTLSLLGGVGVVPWHDPTLAHDYYGAVGVNIAVPIFNGGLFSARHAEAELRAQAAQANLDAHRLQATSEVRSSWIDATDAYRRLAVTDKLLDQATQALRLARVRYDTGLGSIVELNQAQLLQTSAAIAVASAKYDYLTRFAALQYATGALTAR